MKLIRSSKCSLKFAKTFNEVFKRCKVINPKHKELCRLFYDYGFSAAIKAVEENLQAYNKRIKQGSKRPHAKRTS